MAASRGTPLEGDRGAFDTVSNAAKHALDIKNAALLRHLPLPGTAGNVAVDNGTNWESGTPTDPSAIHDDVAGEIAAIDEKTAPVDADVFVIEDSEAGDAKKRVALGSLPTGGGMLALVDGVSEPGTVSGTAWLYVDTFDGQLKLKLGDGLVLVVLTEIDGS